VAAGRSPAESAEAAMSKLCHIYWYPVYAFVRRQGHNEDDARDLTQEFFSRVLEKNYFRDADPARGRFRSFLLAAVRHFLANEWNRERAQKRGGGVVTISLDPHLAEGRYRLEPVDRETPETLFERQWALALLANVMAALQKESADEGKLDQFEKLAPCLTGTSDVAYAELARQWNSSEGAVKVAVHRLRKRYRDLVRREIAETVAQPEEVDDEIRYLLAVLGTK
jgi:RNA polymerase sigma factor (sigma-70 family)